MVLLYAAIPIISGIFVVGSIFWAMVFIFGIFIVGSIAWATMPKWAKAKRRDSRGNYYYEILGKFDSSDTSLYDKIRECYNHVVTVAKEIYRGAGGSFSWSSWLASYMVVVIHRILLARTMSSADVDKMLSADGEEGVEPVRRAQVVGLLTRVKFAQWAYPFDPNYERLEECLRREGYLLVKHNPTTAPGKVAYYVAIHQQVKTLIIVPRGSSALSDLLTNIAAIPVAQSLDDGRVIWSHAGFLTAANNLTEDCIELVERLVTEKGYKLELIGHSLGGAVATLMGCILLARIPELHDTSRFHVFVYAPPPCLDAGASIMIEPYISTIVWNNDIVPTLSVANFSLTFKMLANIEELQYLGSYFLWLRTFLSAVVTWFGFRKSTPMALPKAQLKRTTSRVIEHAKKLHKQRRASMSPHVHVPGKVICLWERRHLDRPTGEINGVRAPGNTFAHLKFVIPTKDSLSNHFLEAYDDGMRRLLDQLGNNSEHRRSMFLHGKYNPADYDDEFSDSDDDDDFTIEGGNLDISSSDHTTTTTNVMDASTDNARGDSDFDRRDYNNTNHSATPSTSSLRQGPNCHIPRSGRSIRIVPSHFDNSEIIITDPTDTSDVDRDNYRDSDVDRRDSNNSNHCATSSSGTTHRSNGRKPPARRIRIVPSPFDESASSMASFSF